jgi:mRNA degradation ribonuclease J1/J2
MADEFWKKKKPLAHSMTSDYVRDRIQKALYDYSRRRPVVMVSLMSI